MWDLNPPNRWNGLLVGHLEWKIRKWCELCIELKSGKVVDWIVVVVFKEGVDTCIEMIS